jgi:hypothetical protein
MGQCYNSTIVDSGIEGTWEVIRDFHELGWATGVVTKLEKVGDVDGDTPGARRILNDAFHETLRSIDDEAYTFSYSIDNGPGPVAADAVSNYLGTVSLHAVTDSGQTFVVWTSSYESDQNDAVAELCNPIYQALLSVLKLSLSA